MVGAALVPTNDVRGPDDDAQKLMEKERLYILDDSEKPKRRAIESSAAKNEPKPIESGSEKKTQ